MTILDKIAIELDNIVVHIDVHDNSLSRKWLSALNHLLKNNYHLEKNFCWVGFADSERNGEFLLQRVNHSIAVINSADLGYHIDDYFSMGTCTDPVTRTAIQSRFNQLHRYFEDLQGQSGRMSPYYLRADAVTRWHIRQLNLLCHEFESWALSWRKQVEAPEWLRPSQLMCWLNAPRFTLDIEDYELFGVETLGRPLGGVFVGVNKAVGKHHWEVFQDEGRDSRIDELTTSAMRGQTEAAGDFDIEWANNPRDYPWMADMLNDFRVWLRANGFDPEDRSLTIGHPQVGQVDLIRSFGTEDYRSIWAQLSDNLNVRSICTSDASNSFPYHWRDDNYIELQVQRIQQGN